MKTRMTSAAKTALRAAFLARGRAWVLASTALLAATAAMAPAAQATPGNFTAASYPKIITGDQDGGTTRFTLGLSGIREITCPTIQYAATITTASESVSFAPTYASCTSGGASTDINVNGCKYTLTVPNVAESKMTTAITSCSSPLEIDVTGACRYAIADQEVAGDITWANKGEDITVSFALGPITTLVEGPKAVCGTSVGNQVPWKIAGSSTLTGFEDKSGAEGSSAALMVG